MNRLVVKVIILAALSSLLAYAGISAKPLVSKGCEDNKCNQLGGCPDSCSCGTSNQCATNAQH
jgi:hypothetical protein